MPRIIVAVMALLLAACAPDAPEVVGTHPCPALSAPAYVWVPPATITLGENSALRPEEGPERQAHVAGFWIATHEVTNTEFAAFVRATNYRTLAERDPPALLNAPSEMSRPGSAVFAAPDASNPMWWRWVVGAQWRRPRGPASSILGKGRHPVVQIATADALAYAHWAGKALPSEEQWESAARQGGANPREPVDAAGNPTANYYQGAFPQRDLGLDGYRGTAPVACFPASQIGTYDMIGNVWEWTRDAARAESDSPNSFEMNVIKGGSFLCASNYCARYRPAARQFQERDLGTDHIGFRLIDPNRPPPA